MSFNVNQEVYSFTSDKYISISWNIKYKVIVTPTPKLNDGNRAKTKKGTHQIVMNTFFRFKYSPRYIVSVVEKK